jgi:hypothetical protein
VVLAYERRDDRHRHKEYHTRSGVLMMLRISVAKLTDAIVEMNEYTWDTISRPDIR